MITCNVFSEGRCCLVTQTTNCLRNQATIWFTRTTWITTPLRTRKVRENSQQWCSWTITSCLWTVLFRCSDQDWECGLRGVPPHDERPALVVAADERQGAIQEQQARLDPVHTPTPVVSTHTSRSAFAYKKFARSLASTPLSIFSASIALEDILISERAPPRVGESECERIEKR